MTRRAHLVVVLILALAALAGAALWSEQGAAIWLAGYQALCG